VADARQHGVEVRPVDVNHSFRDSTLEPHGKECALRLGFRMVGGLSHAAIEAIVEARSDGPFVSFDDFAGRTGLSSAVLSRLSKADAFGSLTLRRRQALWKSLPSQKALPLFDHSLDGSPTDSGEPPVALPEPSPLAEVVADYRATGLSLKDHPMRFLRPMLRRLRVAKASDLAVLPVNQRVKVAGLVLLRQRPSTAKGITFVTLEDETGQANLIIHQQIWERYHHVARTASAMLAHGHLQRQDSVIHVLVTRLQDLSTLLLELQSSSRDFR
jgi:error-prone DNA polymerase